MHGGCWPRTRSEPANRPANPNALTTTAPFQQIPGPLGSPTSSSSWGGFPTVSLPGLHRTALHPDLRDKGRLELKCCVLGPWSSLYPCYIILWLFEFYCFMFTHFFYLIHEDLLSPQYYSQWLCSAWCTLFMLFLLLVVCVTDGSSLGFTQFFYLIHGNFLNLSVVHNGSVGPWSSSWLTGSWPF